MSQDDKVAVQAACALFRKEAAEYLVVKNNREAAMRSIHELDEMIHEYGSEIPGLAEAYLEPLRRIA